MSNQEEMEILENKIHSAIAEAKLNDEEVCIVLKQILDMHSLAP